MKIVENEMKKVFFIRLTILSDFTDENSLNCISKKNENVKQDLKLSMLIVIILYFTVLVSKLVNVVTIVIILMIHTQKFVFLIL